MALNAISFLVYMVYAGIQCFGMRIVLNSIVGFMVGKHVY